jgi:hypothetical protein
MDGVVHILERRFGMAAHVQEMHHIYWWCVVSYQLGSCICRPNEICDQICFYDPMAASFILAGVMPGCCLTHADIGWVVMVLYRLSARDM